MEVPTPAEPVHSARVPREYAPAVKTEGKPPVAGLDWPE
jgi:hypothetical protein